MLRGEASIAEVARVVVLVMFGVGGAGCDGLVDASYRGETLAEVAGDVVLAKAGAMPDAEVVLLWMRTSNDDALAGERVHLSAAFPARFELSIYTPPPDAAFNRFDGDGAGGARLALGFVAAVRAGAALNATATADPDDLLGVAQRHVLAYVDADVREGTVTADLLNDTLVGGFHLMEVSPPLCDIEAEGCSADGFASFDQLTAAPEGFQTSVPLTIPEHWDDLHVPDWN